MSYKVDSGVIQHNSWLVDRLQMRVMTSSSVKFWQQKSSFNIYFYVEESELEKAECVHLVNVYISRSK